jgi:hypothetical protein
MSQHKGALVAQFALRLHATSPAAARPKPVTVNVQRSALGDAQRSGNSARRQALLKQANGFGVDHLAPPLSRRHCAKGQQRQKQKSERPEEN